MRLFGYVLKVLCSRWSRYRLGLEVEGSFIHLNLLSLTSQITHTRLLVSVEAHLCASDSAWTRRSDYTAQQTRYQYQRFWRRQRAAIHKTSLAWTSVLELMPLPRTTYSRMMKEVLT